MWKCQVSLAGSKLSADPSIIRIFNGCKFKFQQNWPRQLQSQCTHPKYLLSMPKLVGADRVTPSFVTSTVSDLSFKGSWHFHTYEWLHIVLTQCPLFSPFCSSSPIVLFYFPITSACVWVRVWGCVRVCVWIQTLAYELEHIPFAPPSLQILIFNQLRAEAVTLLWLIVPHSSAWGPLTEFQDRFPSLVTTPLLSSLFNASS